MSGLYSHGYFPTPLLIEAPARVVYVLDTRFYDGQVLLMCLFFPLSLIFVSQYSHRSPCSSLFYSRLSQNDVHPLITFHLTLFRLS